MPLCLTYHKCIFAADGCNHPCLSRLDLQLSLLVPEPDFVVANWQIQQAVDRHIKPFLQKFPLEVSRSQYIF